MLPSGTRIAALTAVPEDSMATLSDVETDHMVPASKTDLCTTSDIFKSITKMIDETLNDRYPTSVFSLVTSYQNVLNFDGRVPTRTSVVYHRIHTGDASPIRSRPYRVSHMEQRKIS